MNHLPGPNPPAEAGDGTPDEPLPAAVAGEAMAEPAVERSRFSQWLASFGLGELQKEYNNGEPERRGDERNYQKYLDRVADLKANIGRKEADIAAIKRELAKLQ